MEGKLTVAEWRRMRGFSQNEVADRLGISQNGYRKKENGETKFYVDEADKLCAMFRCEYDQILFDLDVPKKCDTEVA